MEATPRPELEEVIITWNCHLDIGYTHPVPEVILKYRTGDMDQILAMFEKTKDAPEEERFRWLLPAWAMDLVLDDQQTPERRAKLEAEGKEIRLKMWLFPWLTYLVIVFIIGCLVTMAFVPDYQVLVFSTGAAAAIVALMGVFMHVRAARQLKG